MLCVTNNVSSIPHFKDGMRGGLPACAQLLGISSYPYYRTDGKLVNHRHASKDIVSKDYNCDLDSVTGDLSS